MSRLPRAKKVANDLFLIILIIIIIAVARCSIVISARIRTPFAIPKTTSGFEAPHPPGDRRRRAPTISSTHLLNILVEAAFATTLLHIRVPILLILPPPLLFLLLQRQQQKQQQQPPAVLLFSLGPRRHLRSLISSQVSSPVRHLDSFFTSPKAKSLESSGTQLEQEPPFLPTPHPLHHHHPHHPHHHRAPPLRRFAPPVVHPLPLMPDSLSSFSRSSLSSVSPYPGHNHV